MLAELSPALLVIRLTPSHPGQRYERSKYAAPAYRRFKSIFSFDNGILADYCERRARVSCLKISFCDVNLGVGKDGGRTTYDRIVGLDTLEE